MMTDVLQTTFKTVKPMGKVTQEQISAAYDVSKKVYLDKLKRSDGVALLSSEYEVNKSSAGDFINCLKCMLGGQVFHRAMSCLAMEHFLKSITLDFSSNHLKNAINALDMHIDYWEKHYKTKVISMKKIANKYRAFIEQNNTAESYYYQLSQEVEASLKRGSPERLERINNAPKIPNTITVSATVYQRNPDVIAETLERAAGVCERCGKGAPFIRSKDGSPYLEVHHIQRLADNGPDTLENTKALCPNCHRELHFG
ncbi:HNH endonuclease [Marinomonas sp. BSi20584]|uniref:HNH endonuclease n=1 Tax=Marinomonas sp. BSi20584 TaxID=1594462 RepID=UPI0018E198C2|nr:HNH endonuclease signature motif containing protein [Marinomonas sp. BSi20584]